MTAARVRASTGWVDLAGAPAPAASYATNVGDGVTTSFNIIHNLASFDVMVQVRETASTQKIIYPEIRKVDSNTITVIFSPAPTTNQYRVLVTGNEFVTTVGTGSAGGDLSGNYPNPQLAAAVVGIPELTAAVLALLPQPGDIKWVPYDVTPANEDTLTPGWKVADGRTTLLTATFPALSALCKPIYGGDATHFTLPPMAGRVVVSKGAGAGLTARVIGTTDGFETHVLLSNQMPKHKHGPGTLGTNAVSAGTPTGTLAPRGNHQHNSSTGTDLAFADGTTFLPAGGGSTARFLVTGHGGTNIAPDHTHPFAGDPLGNHGHSVTTGLTDDGPGADAGHNNMQPWIALTPLIKT